MNIAAGWEVYVQQLLPLNEFKIVGTPARSPSLSVSGVLGRSLPLLTPVWRRKAFFRSGDPRSERAAGDASTIQGAT